MTILIANHILTGYTGSERWTYTIAEELKRLGNTVSICTFHLGKMVNKLMDIGCGVYDINLSVTKQLDSFDLILCNSKICLEKIVGLKPKIKIIYVCHGMIDMEKPIHGADEYISVSWEVSDMLLTKGFQNRIVYNGVRIDGPIFPKALKNVLYINYYRTDKDLILSALIENICSDGGLNLKRLTGDVWDIEESIAQADLVISIGRGIYESLVYGKPVIVAGRHGIDGYMADGETYQNFLLYNCSGRRRRLEISKKTLREAFDQYNPESTKLFYDSVLANHDIRKVVKKLCWK